MKVKIITKSIENPFIWESTFPPVYGHTSVSYLKRCNGFQEAKHGDIQSAHAVVDMCVKPIVLAKIKKKYPFATLIPVISKNRLPEALAQKMGMRINLNVFEIESLSRKGLSAMERLLYKPCFGGKIIKGGLYIIIDDIVTQGGTISALRKYIINCGGSVVAVAALAFSTNSRILTPDMEDINVLNNKFSLLTDTLKAYKIANDPWELTRSEVKYLLRFKQGNNLEAVFNNVLMERPMLN